MYRKGLRTISLLFVLGMISFTSNLYAQSTNCVTLEVAIGSLSDSENYAGFDASATDAYDAGLDAPEPPAPVGDYLRLAFLPMEGAPESFTEFRTDWRAPVAIPLDSAAMWTFFISTTLETGNVSFSAQIGSGLDGSLPVYLWNGVQFYDLRTSGTLQWPAAGLTKHYFTLYIGSPGSPKVTVLNPSPNEELSPSDSVELSWSVASTVSIQRTQLDLSLDGGVHFTPLADADSLLTAVQWTTPDSGVSEARMQVVVTDSLGQQAASSVDFTVLDPVSDLTGLQLVSPASNSILNGGDSVTVDWVWLGGTSNVTGAVIQASSDQGASWDTIATTADTLSQTDWTVPDDLFTNDAWLKVVSTVSDGVAQQDSVEGLTVRPLLLQNRGFEEWNIFGLVTGPPDDWVTSNAVYGSDIVVRPILTGAKVAEGSMAAQADLGSFISATLFQDITEVTPGNQYTFSCQILDNSPGVSASLRLTALNASNTLITAYGSSTSVDQSSYADYSVSLTAPSGTVALRLEILLDANQSGTVYLDDVRLEGAEPSPDVTMLGPPADTVFTYDGVTTLPIRWSYGGTASVVNSGMVDVSYDDGLTWNRIADLTDSSGTTLAWIGADTFSIDTRVRVTAFNSSGLQGSDSTGAFIIRPSRRQVVLASGWHLFSLPLLPEDPSVQAVLGDDVGAGAWVYAWSGGQYVQVDTLEALRAYWLALDEAAAVDVQGEAAISTVQVDLEPGWCLMLNPFPGAIRIDSLEFVRDGDIRAFTDAVLGGWVAGQLYGFDPIIGNYTNMGSGSVLTPFQACWLGTLLDSTVLRVQPPHAADGGGSSISTLRESVENDSNWVAAIVLRSNRGVSRLTQLGVMASATGGFDPVCDYPAPPEDPDGLSQRLLIRAQGTAPATGPWLYRDLRPALLPGDAETWSLSVQSGDEDQLDIDFRELLEALPDNMNASLLYNGTEQELADIPLLHWRSGVDPRELTLRIEAVPQERESPALPARFSVASVWPNPFNRMITLELALPRASHLTLEVFDLLGRQVERRDLGEWGAGFSKVSWQPETASGMYLIRVSTENGESSVRRIILLR